MKTNILRFLTPLIAFGLIGNIAFAGHKHKLKYSPVPPPVIHSAQVNYGKKYYVCFKRQIHYVWRQGQRYKKTSLRCTYSGWWSLHPRFRTPASRYRWHPAHVCPRYGAMLYRSFSYRDQMRWWHRKYCNRPYYQPVW